jgi:hypothetical protein
MSRLEDLRVELNKMSHQEKIDRVNRIREERRINKIREIKAKVQRKRAILTIADKLKGLTPAQLKELGL